MFGFPMCILDKKLRVLKANLKVWNKTKFGNVKTKVIEAEKVLKDLQSEIDLIGYNDLLQAKRNEGSKWSWSCLKFGRRVLEREV